MERGPAVRSGATRRHRRGLIAGLVVDNAGSGMFLPLTVVFIVRSVGLSVGVAGTLLTVGTLAGLLAPAVVGRLSDRVGALPVVVGSMLVQAAGMVCYLLAHGRALTLVAAVLVAAGTQTFYSALFAMISDVAGAGPKDHAFTVVGMARAGAFGAGSLLAGLLLAVASTTALRIAVGVDAASFVVAAAVLWLVVRPGLTPHAQRRPADELRADDPLRSGSGTVVGDRPFLVLIATVALLTLTTDVFLLGLPVYALTVLHTPGWVPGVCLALLTAATSTLAGLVLRRTARVRRTSALGIGAAFAVVWCAAVAVAAALPTGWATPWLLASTLVLIAGSLMTDTRVNAVAEAAAPLHLRGRYLAAFQYAFTVAALIAPLVVALFAVSDWLPWAVVALSALVGMSTLPWLARTLPAQATTPGDRRATVDHAA